MKTLVKTSGPKGRGTPALRLDKLPNIEATENDLIAIAKQSIGTSWQAIENLIDSTPPADKFTLGILGPILSGLRDAERTSIGGRISLLTGRFKKHFLGIATKN